MPLPSTGPISLQDIDTFFDHNSDTSGKLQIEEYYGAAPSWPIGIGGTNGPVSMSAYRGKDKPYTINFYMDSTSSISTVLDDVRTYKSGNPNSPNWVTISQSEWDGVSGTLERLAWTRSSDQGTGNPDADGRRRINNTTTQTAETTMPWYWGEIRLGNGSGYDNYLACSSTHKALLRHYPTLTLTWSTDGSTESSQTFNSLNSTSWTESRITGYFSPDDYKHWVTYLNVGTISPDIRGIIEGGVGYVKVQISGRT